MYANTEIAADRERAEPQIGGKLAKMLIWHRCVISAADHPMRQRSRPHAPEATGGHHT
jgi:hypothetical protein